jgi:hypothetical protein
MPLSPATSTSSLATSTSPRKSPRNLALKRSPLNSHNPNTLPQPQSKVRKTDQSAQNYLHKLLLTKQIRHLKIEEQQTIKNKLNSLDETGYDTIVRCEIDSLKSLEDYKIVSLDDNGSNNGKNSNIHIILDKEKEKPIAVIKVLSGKVIDGFDDLRKTLYATAAPTLSKINAKKFNQLAATLNLNPELPSIVMNKPDTIEQFHVLSLAPFCNGTSLDQFIGETGIENDIKSIEAITIIDTAAEPGSEFDPALTLQDSLSKLSGITNLDHIDFSPWFKEVSKKQISEELCNQIKTFLQRSFNFKDNSNRLNLAVSLTLHVINAKHHKLYVDASLSNFIATQKQDDEKTTTYQELVDIIKTIQPDYSPSSLNQSGASSASTIPTSSHANSTPPRTP